MMIKKLTNRIGKRLIDDERGLAAVEYAVLGAIVVAAIVAIGDQFQTDLAAAFSSLFSSISGS